MPLRLLVVFLATSLSAGAVELRVQWSAIERLLGEQLFSQEGRRYVKGNQTSKCNFAYLEKPQVRGENGKLRIRARFSGRSSLSIAGPCVGLGDAFDVRITASPQYRDGEVRFSEVKVDSEDKSGFYIRRVCLAMESSLARDFHFPVAAEAKKILEAPGGLPAYPREVARFAVSEIRVTPDALVLALDFELTVK